MYERREELAVEGWNNYSIYQAFKVYIETDEAAN